MILLSFNVALSGYTKFFCLRARERTKVVHIVLVAKPSRRKEPVDSPVHDKADCEAKREGEVVEICTRARDIDRVRRHSFRKSRDEVAPAESPRDEGSPVDTMPVVVDAIGPCMV